MHYTSGTTGRPKGVWAGLWDEATAADAFADEADLWSFGPDDVHLVCSPMYHSVSIRFAAGTLLSGGTCVVLTRFDPIVARRALEGTHPGTVPDGAVPTTTSWHRPSSNGCSRRPAGRCRTSFANLRLLVHAGSPAPASLKHAALAAVRPGALWEFYGSTEGQFTVCSPDEWQARPGTVGRARPGRTARRRPGRHHLVSSAGLRLRSATGAMTKDGGGVAGRLLHGGRPRPPRR